MALELFGFPILATQLLILDGLRYWILGIIAGSFLVSFQLVPSLKLPATCDQTSFTQTGNASYYSNKFQGRRTASGATYHKDSMYCAHKSLKYGTILKVTNLKNDSVIVVKVVDRMGKSSPHIIDLSMAGAQKLNFVRNGITKVKVEEVIPVPVAKAD
ncbi:septal ring lytic transglycosylase RlpA family protein [uncultured Fluviicola sp.]|uniref:septal ring lytic transglycosylase RlpA family protein n=1 Tax=uncultured Fluviicola sp. TaxID=463303 RepID=UPI0025F7B3BA|nr:septal ring lytic transglycosylase RlpA family protein [uncultured Fluviicola sp.]